MKLRHKIGAGIAVALLSLGIAAPAEAVASSATVHTKPGAGWGYGYIYVMFDDGNAYWIAPNDTVWYAAWVIARDGQCIRVMDGWGTVLNHVCAPAYGSHWMRVYGGDVWAQRTR